MAKLKEYIASIENTGGSKVEVDKHELLKLLVSLQNCVTVILQKENRA